MPSSHWQGTPLGLILDLVGTQEACGSRGMCQILDLAHSPDRMCITESATFLHNAELFWCSDPANTLRLG